MQAHKMEGKGTAEGFPDSSGLEMNRGSSRSSRSGEDCRYQDRDRVACRSSTRASVCGNLAERNSQKKSTDQCLIAMAGASLSWLRSESARQNAAPEARRG